MMLRYFETLATPTTRIHLPFTWKRLPTGFSPCQYCVTIASFTIATGGEFSLSARVNSRPEMSGIPIVEQYDGLTSLYESMGCSFVAGSYPSTATEASV